MIHSATRFDPMGGFQQADIFKKLRKYTHHIMEDRAHFLQFCYVPDFVHSAQD